jgi:hypothetical protein
MKKAQQKLKKVAKATRVEPTAGSVSLPPAQPKRGRGRPKTVSLFNSEVGAGSATFADAKKFDPKLDPKALVTFRRAIADAEQAMMTPEDFDGGGTAVDAHSVTKESLQRRVTRRLNVLDRFLTDDKLVELLAFSSLKEIGIYEGIMLDKSLVLQGQPNVIIGNDDRNAMASVLPRLMEELKRIYESVCRYG